MRYVLVGLTALCGAGLLWAEPAVPTSRVEGVATPQPVSVTGKLLRKSRIPNLESIAPYKEALVVFAYEVTESSDTSLKGKQLPIAHWAIYERVTQPVTQQAIGTTVSLRLRALSEFPGLADWKRSGKNARNVPSRNSSGAGSILGQQ